MRRVVRGARRRLGSRLGALSLSTPGISWKCSRMVWSRLPRLQRPARPCSVFRGRSLPRPQIDSETSEPLKINSQSKHGHREHTKPSLFPVSENTHPEADPARGQSESAYFTYVQDSDLIVSFARACRPPMPATGPDRPLRDALLNASEDSLPGASYSWQSNRRFPAIDPAPQRRAIRRS